MNKILITSLLLSILMLPGCGKKDSNPENTQNTNAQTQNTPAQDNQDESNNTEDEQQTNNNSEAEQAPFDPEFTDQKSAEVVTENTDSYGCLTDAGYTWCESKQLCVKDWEPNCSPGSKPPEAEYDMDRAIQIATDYFQNSETYQGASNLNILNVSQQSCTGCWTIEFEYQKTIENEDQLFSTEVNLKDWQVQN